MENLEKSWNFKLVIKEKSLKKNLISKSFGKVMDMCYIYMFNYAVCLKE